MTSHFWNTDRGLPVLLGSLVVLIFLAPPLLSRPESTLLVQIFFTLVYLSALSVVGPKRLARVIGTVALAGGIGLHWLHYFNPGPLLGIWTAVGRLLAISVLTVLVLLQVLREGMITVQRIQGAVAVYLLLGLTWTGVYELIYGIWPGAFRFSDAVHTRPELAASLAYYSFVTLTTMGYGDITPVHPVARSAAILEALTGQLFPAILIARLVAMELTARERGDRTTRRA